MLLRTPHHHRQAATIDRVLGRFALPLAAAAAAALLLILPAAASAGRKVHRPINLVGVHNKVYDSLDFEGAGDGWGDSSGVIRISGRSHDITFRNCVIGTNKDGVGNGVKIWDTGDGMHDITFRNCIFKYQPRMGFECVASEVGSRTGYQHINLINCTFAAGAGQAISYGDTNGTAGRCLVSGNLVKGGGVGSTYEWGRVFEINGTHNMTVADNIFYAGRDGILNLQMHDGRASGWVFSDNVVDARHVEQGITVVGLPIIALNIHGGSFPHNKIINLNAPHIAYIEGCSNLDWRTTRWRGPNHVPYQTDCSGNHF